MDTAMRETIHQIYGAVIDLVGLMNQPQRDAGMIAAAGISLDRALFPLLVGIGRAGPIGVGELADQVGRDYTTVSRQVAKLEQRGLVERRPAPADKRVHEALLTAAGRAMTDAIDQARDRIMSQSLADWSADDLAALAVLLGRFVESARKAPSVEDGPAGAKAQD